MHRHDPTLLHLQAKKALQLQARQPEERAALGAGQKSHRVAAPRRHRQLKDGKLHRNAALGAGQKPRRVVALRRRRQPKAEEVHRREQALGRKLGLRGITGSQLAHRQRSHKNKNNRYLLGKIRCNEPGASRAFCQTGNQPLGSPSTAAVSAGRYFTPISHANPEAKMTPDTKRNATCMLAWPPR